MFALMNQDYTQKLSNFDGVLVQLETTLTYGKKDWNYVTTLDVSKLQEQHVIPTMPWTREKTSAWIQQPKTYNSNEVDARTGQYTHIQTALYYREGDGSPKQQNERMKALAIKVTGDEKVKTTGLYNAIYFGFW